MLLVYSSFFFLSKRNRIFVFFCAGKKEASGNAVVQVWNGYLGGWMVAGGSTGLLIKFLAR